MCFPPRISEIRAEKASFRRHGSAEALGILRHGRAQQLLRNIQVPGGDDRLARGLACASALLDGVGAWRVHGGGFAGGVQALMPCTAFPAYRQAMEARFGPGSCRELRITGAE